MNREIKFRVWDTKLQKMLNWNPYIRFDDSDYIVQQFTGSSDEHGREIFEGDILKRTYNVECFKMSDGTTLEGCIPGNLSIEKENFSVVEWKGIGFDLGGITRIGWHQKSSPKVVGNIFENPELLAHEP